MATLQEILWKQQHPFTNPIPPGAMPKKEEPEPVNPPVVVKGKTVFPKPGVTVSRDESGDVVTRVTLRPGESSKLGWRAGPPTTPEVKTLSGFKDIQWLMGQPYSPERNKAIEWLGQGGTVTYTTSSTPYTLEGGITSARKTEGIKPIPVQEKGIFTSPEQHKALQKWGENVMRPGADIAKGFWYSGQKGPEQLAEAPGHDVKLEIRPSTRSIMAETFAGSAIAFAPMGLIGEASSLAKGATGIWKTFRIGSKTVNLGWPTVYRGSQAVMLGSIATGIGASEYFTYTKEEKGEYPKGSFAALNLGLAAQFAMVGAIARPTRLSLGDLKSGIGELKMKIGGEPESPYVFVKSPAGLPKPVQVSLEDIVANRRYLIDVGQKTMTPYKFSIDLAKSGKVSFDRQPIIEEGLLGEFRWNPRTGAERITLEETLPRTKIGSAIKSNFELSKTPDATFKFATEEEVLTHELVHRERLHLGSMEENYYARGLPEEKLVEMEAGRTRLFSESGQAMADKFTFVSDIDLLKGPVELERVGGFTNIIKTSSAESSGITTMKIESYKGIPPPRAIQLTLEGKPLIEKTVTMGKFESDIDIGQFKLTKDNQLTLDKSMGLQKIKFFDSLTGEERTSYIPSKEYNYRLEMKTTRLRPLWSDTSGVGDLLLISREEPILPSGGKLTFKSEFFGGAEEPAASSKLMGWHGIPIILPVQQSSQLMGQRLGEINTSGLKLGELTAQERVSFNIDKSAFDMDQGSGRLSLQLRGVLSRQAQAQDQLQLQQFKQEQMQVEGSELTFDKITTGFPLELGDTIVEQKKKKKPSLSFGKPGFNVFIKSRHYFHGTKTGPGIYQKVNVEPLSHEAAMSLLGSKLKLGAAATGKIMITGEGEREVGSSRYQWGSIANQFYQKGEGTFVQKREYRMGTKPEHHEITMGKTSRKKARLSL